MDAAITALFQLAVTQDELEADFILFGERLVDFLLRRSQESRRDRKTQKNKQRDDEKLPLVPDEPKIVR
ncbi:MAG: hypothetical protein OEZ45_04470 [Candidatus Aminicenantes bacterium]|nr:hypothetical protein [Candidatus Aminicenantes bacterium]